MGAQASSEADDAPMALSAPGMWKSRLSRFACSDDEMLLPVPDSFDFALEVRATAPPCTPTHQAPTR